MKIRLVCIEDGLENIGFRKIASYIKNLNSDTKAVYAPTGNKLGIIRTMVESDYGNLDKDDDINKLSTFLSEGDIVGISSMTAYSPTVHKVVKNIKKIKPKTFVIWGGIHPIIHPDDAIKHADAICTGEGEFAFKTFLELYEKGDDYTKTPSFWFKKDGKIIKNRNFPLMTPKEMDNLPSLMYEDGEYVFHPGKGVESIKKSDFLKYGGLTYSTIWSIGCPFHCTYCGNTKFIEHDSAYKRLRHSSARYIIDELKRVSKKHPHISTINFHDDSFLALPYVKLEEFCKLYKEEVKIPFAVVGIIPNYVKEDKITLLLDAGMNRVRMGIQSGSENILEFYKRPTKLLKIKEGMKIFNKYKKYMIPPAYDIILDNPVEKDEDARATVDLIYEMPRPFTLNVYALRIIPNTPLAKDLEARGISIPSIKKNHFGYQKTLGNCLIFALCIWKIPEWLYKILRNKVHPSYAPQKHYPVLFFLCRTSYLIKRALQHIRFLDFSFFPGKPGYYLWKLKIIQFWQKFMLKKYNLQSNETGRTIS